MSIILYQKTLITVGICDVRMKNVSIPLTATRQWNRKLIAHSCGWKGDQDADTIFRTKRLSRNSIPSIVVRYHNETFFSFFAYRARKSNADKNL